ncbi:MAG: beta-aspartyl-peptidase [Pseudomonadota bacterium]
MPVLLQLITNADVYAPESLGVQHVLVGGGQVLWMGASLPSLDAELGVASWDAAGRRVVPGFVDCHAHTTGGGGESGYASRVPAPPLSLFTAAGVTTVLGLLGTDDTTRDTGQLLAATRALRAEGLSAWCYTGGYRVPPVTFTGDVRSDIVNLEPVIGVGEIAISDHRSSQPTLEEILRVASDAHVAGLMTGKAGVLHLHLGDGPRGLELVRMALAESELPPRVFHPTHCNRRRALFDEAVELAKTGCWIDLTAFPVEEDEDAWTAADGFLRYAEAGAPADRITVSSDGGGCLPHFNDAGEVIRMGIGTPDSLAGTLAELTAAGIPLADALPAFTSNPATLLRLHGKGRLAVGRDADLVVLDDAGAVDGVMARGTWHRRDGEQLVAGTFESL